LNADIYLTLAKANAELGLATVELLIKLTELRRRIVAEMDAELVPARMARLREMLAVIEGGDLEYEDESKQLPLIPAGVITEGG
jgi:hypothetical protein